MLSLTRDYLDQFPLPLLFPACYSRDHQLTSCLLAVIPTENSSWNRTFVPSDCQTPTESRHMEHARDTTATRYVTATSATAAAMTLVARAPVT